VNRTRPQPLYRKENTTAHMERERRRAGDFSDVRHSKAERELEALRRPMHGKVQRGRDYTPLFRFLLSKVGGSWKDVRADAVPRLDRSAPIFWMVALREEDRREAVRVGESSFFSGLYVDDEGVLRIVNPEIGPSTYEPGCRCCTHTFNGVLFTKPYRGP
jgi:hypothetical protein